MSTFLEISRASMHEATMQESPAAELGANQVRLSVDRFGITANNITYGLFGVAMRYWDFFPAADGEHGRLPVWGFGTVVESRHPDIATGRRLYGYWQKLRLSGSSFFCGPGYWLITVHWHWHLIFIRGVAVFIFSKYIIRVDHEVWSSP